MSALPVIIDPHKVEWMEVENHWLARSVAENGDELAVWELKGAIEATVDSQSFIHLSAATRLEHIRELLAAFNRARAKAKGLPT